MENRGLYQAYYIFNEPLGIPVLFQISQKTCMKLQMQGNSNENKAKKKKEKHFIKS